MLCSGFSGNVLDDGPIVKPWTKYHCKPCSINHEYSRFELKCVFYLAILMRCDCNYSCVYMPAINLKKVKSGSWSEMNYRLVTVPLCNISISFGPEQTPESQVAFKFSFS